MVVVPPRFPNPTQPGGPPAKTKPIPITKIVKPGTPVGGVPPTTPAVKLTSPAGSSKPAAAASGGALLKQPAFDTRITTIIQPFNMSNNLPPPTRGRMIWDQAVAPYKQPAQLNFLYNPSTISIGYNTATSGAPASILAYRSTTDKGAPKFPMQQTVNFTLLFDRTYELWGSYNMSTGLPNSQTSGQSALTDPTQMGVGADLICMQQLTGQFMSQTGSVGGAITGKSTATNFQLQGPMIFIPTWVYFGSPTPSNYFYGWITDYQVQITHWTQLMVPMRCVIDVDFSLMPPPSNDASTGPGTNFWWVKKPVAGGVGPGSPGTVNPGGPSQLKPTPPTKGVSGR